MTRGPLSGIVKRLGGIHPDRTPPHLRARRTFRDGPVCGSPPSPGGREGDGERGPGGEGPTVLLWPDTFTNYFQPEIARAAWVEVLEAAGHRVA